MSDSFLNLAKSEKFNDLSYKKSTKFIGDLLEISTAIFQEHVISQSYNPNNLEYIIETNKILKDSNGAKSEIDVWVEIRLKHGHGRVIAYECKNWQAKVGRSDIDIFKTKIRNINKIYTESVTGVFVAKTFTEDALLACKTREDNVQPLTVSDSGFDDFKIKLTFYGVNDTHTMVTALGSDARIYNVETMKNSGDFDFKVEGKKVDINTIVNSLIDHSAIDELNKKRIIDIGGEGDFQQEWNNAFQVKDFSFQKKDEKPGMIEKLMITVTKIGFFSKGKIVSKFDFEKERRIVIMELKTSNDNTIPLLIEGNAE